LYNSNKISEQKVLPVFKVFQHIHKFSIFLRQTFSNFVYRISNIFCFFPIFFFFFFFFFFFDVILSYGIVSPQGICLKWIRCKLFWDLLVGNLSLWSLHLIPLSQQRYPIPESKANHNPFFFLKHFCENVIKLESNITFKVLLLFLFWHISTFYCFVI
jgi:hypothetical protein